MSLGTSIMTGQLYGLYKFIVGVVHDLEIHDKKIILYTNKGREEIMFSKIYIDKLHVPGKKDRGLIKKAFILSASLLLSIMIVPLIYPDIPYIITWFLGLFFIISFMVLMTVSILSISKPKYVLVIRGADNRKYYYEILSEKKDLILNKLSKHGINS
ncbi:MAG: hypothetical protein DRO16_02165 [Thermoprotei archaeon]|nr:MAG: hypothetical protein DRO16_02165 [Thermoprotei archaeon]